MAEIKFEEALKKLEKIVEDLEAGELSLEDALKVYEEGIQLARLCSKKLETAKKKVELLLQSPDGSIVLKPFDEERSEEATQRNGTPKRPKKL